MPLPFIKGTPAQERQSANPVIGNLRMKIACFSWEITFENLFKNQ